MLPYRPWYIDKLSHVASVAYERILLKPYIRDLT